MFPVCGWLEQQTQSLQICATSQPPLVPLSNSNALLVKIPQGSPYSRASHSTTDIRGQTIPGWGRPSHALDEVYSLSGPRLAARPLSSCDNRLADTREPGGWPDNHCSKEAQFGLNLRQHSYPPSFKLKLLSPQLPKPLDTAPLNSTDESNPE